MNRPSLSVSRCRSRYEADLEIKDITDTDRSASYLDLHLETESEGRFIAKLYDKRDTFNCYLIFLFICSNIPAAIFHSG
jgi:hypothetical protein